MFKLPKMSVETGKGGRKKSKRGAKWKSSVLAVCFTLLTALTQQAPAPPLTIQTVQTNSDTDPNTAFNFEMPANVPLEMMHLLDGQSFAEHPKSWASQMSGSKYEQEHDMLDYLWWQRGRHLQTFEIDYSVVPDNEGNFYDSTANDACAAALQGNEGQFYNYYFYECICYIAAIQYGSQSSLYSTGNCNNLLADNSLDGYQITTCTIIQNANRCANMFDCTEFDRCYCLNRVET